MIAAGTATAGAEGAQWLGCTPALPFYCANIHIGCAGRSDVPTVSFALSLDPVHVIRGNRLEPPWIATTVGDDAIVVRQQETDDWIRLVPEGAGAGYRYSERVHRRGQALMTRGRCTPERLAPPPAAAD